MLKGDEAVELRQMATAFLWRDDKVLLMRKTNSRLHDGAFWTGLGGHLEAEELNRPRQACLREINEESGLAERDIEHLTLRYILLRVKEDEIRQQFVYFGAARRADVVSSEEGELFWVERERLLELPMSRIVACMLEHYLQHPELQSVMVGTMTLHGESEPRVQWAELKDPGLF